MGKINRIQLRGISRTPSDRMNSDGGVAESLNMYIDEAESAPALLPKDVTSELGLPDGLQAEKVFVHKTANYENFITAQRDSDDHILYLFGWTRGIQQPICSLEDKEEIQSVTSIGNTVIVSTSIRPIYILFKDGKYSFLGDAIPMPTVEFFDKETPIKNLPEGSTTSLSYPATLLNNSHIEVVGFQGYSAEGNQSINDATIIDFVPPYWDRLDEDGNHEIEGAKKVVADMKTLYDSLKKSNSEKGVLNSPVWVTFGVRLYDGSLKMSVPYMVSGGIETPVDIFALHGNLAGASFYFLRINHYYQLGVRLYDYTEQQIKPWSDIIKGIDVYMSEDINALDWKTMSVEERTDNGTEVYAKFKVSGLEGNYFDYAASCTTFAKIAEFAIDETFYKSGTPSINEIRQDYIIDMKGKILNEDRLSSLLSDEDYTFIWNAYKGKATTFNNRVLTFDLSELLSSGPTWLLSQRYNSALPIPRMNANLDGTPMTYPAWWENASFEDSSEMLPTNYYLTYYVKSELGEEAVVYGVSNGDTRFSMDYNRNQLGNLKPIAFPLFMYPDHRCKMIDITNGGRTITLEMKPHPYLPNCSVAYVNADLYWMFEGETSKEIPAEKKTLGIPNKLGLSKMDNPLFFDSSSFYTFQSKVLGVAIASTALSQGQFGQFPLYVFTEDGIWAMETAADGSFVTSKPLSRDVCVNPDSITSIDNAVIFVTDKGVMLLQGSQVVNISPNMNGRHYRMEENAKVIINGQYGFKDLIPAVTDDTHFMAFVKEATIAYDYPGQRLIFIKKGETFQYIYKLDTNTWHKTAYGINMTSPINSYPECLVKCDESVAVTKTYWKVTQNQAQEDFAFLAERIREVLSDIRDEEIDLFLYDGGEIDVTEVSDDDREWLLNEMDYYHVATIFVDKDESGQMTRIYNLSTPLDVEAQTPTKGIIVTRPFDLQAPDVLKTITDLRVRGQYERRAVKFILLASMDGIHFHVINTRRGKAWKMFRLIILADLKPTERISWIDVEYEERFTNRLR